MPQNVSQVIRASRPLVLRNSSHPPFWKGPQTESHKIDSLRSFSASSKRLEVNRYLPSTISSNPILSYLWPAGGLASAVLFYIFNPLGNARLLLDSNSNGSNNNNCTNCHNCTNCNDCTDCTNCSNCNDCARCKNCSNCDDCVDCVNCSNCDDCSGLRNASNQTGVHR